MEAFCHHKPYVRLKADKGINAATVIKRQSAPMKRSRCGQNKTIVALAAILTGDGGFVIANGGSWQYDAVFYWG